MTSAQIAVIVYAVLYAASLALAVWRKKTFPLGDALATLLIAGVGFTGLVYLATLLLHSATIPPANQPAALAFALVYVVIVAVLLIRGAPVPESWKEHFFRKGFFTVAFKLVVFVIVPLAAMRLLWKQPWASLGFAAGDVPGQILVAAILILILGGFNLFMGSAAAPIRARRFPLGQVAAGMGLAFLWNMVEVGLVEEFFFRGFLQTQLIGFFGGPVAGIGAAALIFGLAHVPGIYLRRGDEHGPLGEHPTLIDSVLYCILALSPTGWFTGLLFWQSGSLLAPILVHAAVDAVAHAVDFLEAMGFKRQESNPE